MLYLTRRRNILFPCPVIKGMSGKIAVAPCGHTGETIIGTFVKCLVGCDGKPVVSKRAEVGHVINCTCTACRIRSESEYIILRTRKGVSVVTIPWDGTANEVDFASTSIFTITNYRFVSALGDTVAQGAIDDITLLAGLSMSLKVKNLIDCAVNDRVCKDPFEQKARTLGGIKFTITAPPLPTQVPATPAIITPPTIAKIEAAMKQIVDVLEVDVVQKVSAFHIKLTRVSMVADQMAGWKNNRQMIQQDMMDWCKLNLPAGSYAVSDYTAKFCLHWAIEDFTLECKLKLQQPANLVKYVTDHLLMTSGYGPANLNVMHLPNNSSSLEITDKWGIPHSQVFTP